MNIRLDQCPVCKGREISKSLTAKDHLVTQESFDIYACKSCELKFTNPRPADDSLAKYYDSDEYISHTNIGTSFVNTFYKIARKFALRGKRKLIEKHSERKTLLDIGCGTGHFMASCKANNWKVMGVEPNDIAREQAIQNTTAKIYKELSDVGDEQFDTITMWHVLEHLPDLDKTITILKRLITTNGTIIIAVPNFETYEENKFKEYWAAYDVPRHLYHFNKTSIKTLSKKHGLKIVKISPMWLDSFYISLLSNKNKFGRNKYLNSFITGLLSNIYAKNLHNTSSLIYQIKKSE
jgi:2-polyprenyl-3-methyl-5-hydroxy-6-metoxy-1,4-benzoquinol methylase